MCQKNMLSVFFSFQREKPLKELSLMDIMVSSDLSSSEQVKKAVSAANLMLYWIKISFKFFDIQMANVFYKTFVRPQLESAVAAWNPYLQGDFEK